MPSQKTLDRFDDEAHFEALKAQYIAQTNVPAVRQIGIEVGQHEVIKPTVRTFATGATRDTDEGKLDFEGFLSPLVLKAFAEYMHEKRKMPDGSMRDSDNWQKGIPLDAYMKSMWRHFFAVWGRYRTAKVGEFEGAELEAELLALFFNVQGMAHEILKDKQ